MPKEVTRRHFLARTVGLSGGATVMGDLLPLLARAAKRKQILRMAVDTDFASLRPDICAGDTNHMLKRLIYTPPFSGVATTAGRFAHLQSGLSGDGARHHLQSV
jgi:hypothetical protein